MYNDDGNSKKSAHNVRNIMKSQSSWNQNNINFALVRRMNYSSLYSLHTHKTSIGSELCAGVRTNLQYEWLLRSKKCNAAIAWQFRMSYSMKWRGATWSWLRLEVGLETFLDPDRYVRDRHSLGINLLSLIAPAYFWSWFNNVNIGVDLDAAALKIVIILPITIRTS